MNPTVSALAWTLIHFLWEGSLIAVLLALALQVARRPTVRYGLSCAAMLLMLAAASATFIALRAETGDGVTAAVSATQSEPATPAGAAVGPQATRPTRFGDYLPWLVYLWMGGVLALSVRTGAGFVVAQRLKQRHCSPLPEAWEERFRRLAQRLAIARTVRACQSAIADVPAVVGWLRPVVLVPASALMGLPAPDVEALLAHELAHIRRNDYLVNLLQTGVETLLFYHPAVWWTGTQIRAERENCCDDLAVAVCGDVLTYARALTRLEQMRAGTPAVAMAANNGSLLARVRRLIRPADAVQSPSSDWVTGVAIVLSVAAIYAAGYVPVPRAMAAQTKPSLTMPRFQRAAFIPAPREEQPSGLVEQLNLVRRFSGPEKQLDRKARELARVSQTLALLEAQITQPQQNTPGSSGLIEGLAAEGYKNLSVDDLISFKIHGVTPDFIRRVKAAGFQPTPDELVSMRIHGVEPDQIAAYKAASIDKLTIDDLISFRIHGATPEFVNAIRAAGYSKADADDIVSLRIHGVTPEFAKEVKSLGLGNPSLDDLVSMRINGVTSEFAREMKAFNLRELDLDSLVELRIHGVTPGFIREVQKRGFKDLTVDQIVRLKQFNILGNSEVF